MGPPASQSAHRGGGLRYRLLGPLAVERIGDGRQQTVELGPPKQRAVLALLLLNRGRIVSTDRLIEAVWVDDPPPSALASLQAYVSNLRRALRETAGTSATIMRRASGYVIDVAAERLDVAEFASLARAAREATDSERWGEAASCAAAALAAWQGELLEDLRDQAWVETEVKALAELRTECREMFITALLAEGRLAPALHAAQELRTAFPRRDRACWLEMIALHRAGRSSEALEVYARHVARLDEELGLEPGSELRDLQVAILRHEPALIAWPRRAAWTGAARVEPQRLEAPAPEPESESAAAEHSLVGREREAGALAEWLAETRAGRPRWITLTGPAGIGKTRLAQELAARARGLGGREVWARCSEEDGAPAWWPIRQLIRALDEDPDVLLQTPPGVELDEARFVLYERVADLLQRVAADGLLLVALDDLQWSDRTSARCLAHLVGALRALPVGFVLTLRDGEETSALAALLTALARSDGHRQLAVGPLSVSAVQVLTAQIAGDAVSEPEAERLTRRTGGNPLFVSEYARLPSEDRRRGDIPLAVRTVLERRLASLREPVIEGLRAAAVIGDALDMVTLAAVTGTDPDALADLLDEAADEHIIVASPDTGGYAFAHGLVREAILGTIPGMRRQRLHARVAAVLEDPDDGDRVMRRAQHLVAALPLADAAAALDGCRAAARVATERFSSETAAEWWAEAVRVFDLQPAGARSPGERDDLLVAQVAALARSGRGRTIVDVLDAGLADALRAGREDTAGRLAACLLRTAGAWPWGALGAEPGPLMARLEEAERFVRGDPAAHARVLAARSVGRCYDPDPAVPDELSRRAIARAEALEDPEVLADALLGRLITYSGVPAHAEESLVLSERLQALPHREAAVDAVTARSVTTMSLMTLGRVQECADVVAETSAEADRLRLVVPRLQLRYMEGTIALWRGDLVEAERLHAIAARVHAHSELYYAGSWLMSALSRAWSPGELADQEPRDEAQPEAWGAAIAAARGEVDRARSLVQAWLAGIGPWSWVTLGHLTLVAHAITDAELEDLAERVLEMLEPNAGRLSTIGHIGLIGPVDLARGRLQALLGQSARATATLRGALAHAEATGGRPAADRCRAELARLGVS